MHKSVIKEQPTITAPTTHHQKNNIHTTKPSLPKVTFSTFILSLASSALSQLGEVPNPETGKLEENLTMAQHTIEILNMLENKTKECLDSDEIKLLQGILYELRMKYVMKKN